jgi:hypothetical protein
VARKRFDGRSDVKVGKTDHGLLVISGPESVLSSHMVLTSHLDPEFGHGPANSPDVVNFV